jgi:hypothetical protein
LGRVEGLCHVRRYALSGQPLGEGLTDVVRDGESQQAAGARHGDVEHAQSLVVG